MPNTYSKHINNIISYILHRGKVLLCLIVGVVGIIFTLVDLLHPILHLMFHSQNTKEDFQVNISNTLERITWMELALLMISSLLCLSIATILHHQEKSVEKSDITDIKA